MAKPMCAASAFTAWMVLRLVDDESDFDFEMLAACERVLLTQEITSDLAAIQVATVVQATMEDGERTDRLAIDAIRKIIDYIAGRDEQTRSKVELDFVSEQRHPSSTQ